MDNESIMSQVCLCMLKVLDCRHGSPVLALPGDLRAFQARELSTLGWTSGSLSLDSSQQMNLIDSDDP